MTKSSTVFLSLGSNLGRRREIIGKALEMLSARGVGISSISSFYETEPVGDAGLPLFINIVCRAATCLNPLELLETCQEVEWNLGRLSKGDQAPRPIDIDILFFNDRKIETLRLTVPHRDLHKRNFVLLPLKEISPDFVNPVTGEHIDEMIEKCEDRSWVIRSG